MCTLRACMCVCVRVCKEEWVGCAEGARTVGVELQVQRLAGFIGCCAHSSDSLAGTTLTTILCFFSHKKTTSIDEIALSLRRFDHTSSRSAMPSATDQSSKLATTVSHHSLRNHSCHSIMLSFLVVCCIGVLEVLFQGCRAPLI